MVFTSLAFHCTEPPGLVAAAAGRSLADRQEVGVGAAVVLIGLVRLGCDALLAPVHAAAARISVAGVQWAAGGFVLCVERLKESLAGRLASLRESAAQVVCRQVEL